MHELLTEKAAAQEVGQHGLVALDWWNGNRSILVDSDLSGLLIGQTLQTKPEDIYRALLESTAFGARVIIENYEKHGVPVNEITIAGGLLKNKFLMQMYADVTRRPLSAATVAQAGAHGSAIFAALAAEKFNSLDEATKQMGAVIPNAYAPDEARAKQYDQLFEQYVRLYELFGTETGIMHQLKRIRREAHARKG